MNKIIVIVLATAMLLSGCKYFDGPEVPPQEVVIIKPDPVPEFKARKVEFEIWDQKRIAVEAAKNNGDKIWYVLTPEHATNLFDNLIDLSDILGKTKNQVKYYQDGIDQHNERIKKATK